MKKIIVAFAFITIGGALSGVGCSSSSDGGLVTGVKSDGGPGGGGDGNTANATADSACTSLASAICDRTSACTSFALSAIYGDSGTCNDREKLACMATLNAPGTSATPSSTQACANSFPQLSCDSFAQGNFGSACTIQAGKTANGSACGDSSQCQSAFCAISPTANCGTCAAPVTAGGGCVSGACPSGLGCDTTSMKCESPGTGQIGAACTDQSQCDVAHGVGCNTNSMQCLKLNISTGTCGADSSTPTMFAVCPKSGTCSALLNGTCSDAAADGATCDPTNGPACLPPARCVGGKCALPDATTCN